MRLGVAAAPIGNELVPGDVAISDGATEGIGLPPAGKAGLALPEFIDGQIRDYKFVSQRLAPTGVTALQPTLIKRPPRDYLTALERLGAGSIRSGHILGMHLKGPFLSPAGCALTTRPTCSIPVSPPPTASSGPVTHMTVAPELPGALEAAWRAVRSPWTGPSGT